MMKQLCVATVILLLASITSVPASVNLFEGSMVGVYGFGVTETVDEKNPNLVNLTLIGGVNGVNLESPYYNSGLTETLVSIRCQGPGQDQDDNHHLDWTLLYSNLSEQYPNGRLQWSSLPIALVITFTITLQEGFNEVVFTIDTETDVIDFSDNSSQKMSESAFLQYKVKTNYTSSLMRDLLNVGLYSTGVGITIVIIVAVARLVSDEPKTSSRVSLARLPTQ